MRRNQTSVVRFCTASDGIGITSNVKSLISSEIYGQAASEGCLECDLFQGFEETKDLANDENQKERNCEA